MKPNETKQMKLNWRVIYLCAMREMCEIYERGIGRLECIKKGQSDNKRKQIFIFMRMLITYNFGHLEYSPDELVRADLELGENMFCL